MLETNLHCLHAALGSVAPASGLAWLEQALIRLAASDELDQTLSLLSAMARRQLGQARLAMEPMTLATPAGDLDVSTWTAADAGRVVLLLEAARLQPARGVELVTHTYRQGDEIERMAVARGLSLFPDGAALKPLALDIGRTNSLPLFAALALANPYPAAYYSDHEFNQLVLKVAFMGLALEAIIGLSRRANPELSRMCEDYLDERIAANRPAPVDIWLALAPCASERGEQLLIEYAGHSDIRHRYYAALALLQRQAINPALRQVLVARLPAETDDRILNLLRQQGLA
jgi:hypothetical protein